MRDYSRICRLVFTGVAFGSMISLVQAATKKEKTHDPGQDHEDVAGPPQWVVPPGDLPPATRYETFDSKSVGGRVCYAIYLPPGYDAKKEERYPVLFFCHGSGGNAVKIAKYAEEIDPAVRGGNAPEMLVVFVNGLAFSQYMDAPDGTQPVESSIIKNLVPHIDRT